MEAVEFKTDNLFPTIWKYLVLTLVGIYILVSIFIASWDNWQFTFIVYLLFGWGLILLVMSIRFYRKFEKCHVKVDDTGIYGKFEIERDIRHYQGALWHINERTLIGLLKQPEYEEFTMK